MLFHMDVESVYLRTPARVHRPGWLKACVSALLVLAMSVSLAGEPCQPFEGGRVDARLLEVMRSAAREGRLYRVVPGNSRVGFVVRHFPRQKIQAEFTNIVGGLVMPSMANPYGQALLLIHTNPLETSDAGLAPLVKGPEFIDASRFPEILFIGRAFEWLAPLQGYIYGDLTLRGKTQPVMFNVSVDFIEEGLGNLPDRIFVKATGQVNRYRFDMRSRRFTVNETVHLHLAVEMVPWGP